MAELIEWRPHKPGVNFIKDIILHFDGREYSLGRGHKERIWKRWVLVAFYLGDVRSSGL